MKNKITILGIGNRLYADEGIGVYCVSFLEEIYRDCDDVLVVDGATDGMMLLTYVENTEKLIVIDAICKGEAPGTIIRLFGDEVPDYCGVKISIHQQGFSEVLGVAKFRDCYPKEVVMIGLEPFLLELNPEVTEEAKKKAEEIIKEITCLVDCWRLQ